MFHFRVSFRYGLIHETNNTLPCAIFVFQLIAAANTTVTLLGVGVDIFNQLDTIRSATINYYHLHH